MADPKGDKLFVNLSAAETKRRLKGFGHGVRKVQSAGRKQALIIHTAVGKHLEELQSLFHDVGCATNSDRLGQPIENLRNLGTTSGQWLRDVGITTIADLHNIGPVIAYRMVERQQGSASLNLLWAMAAGLMKKDWRELTCEEKQALRAELDITA